jgi:hypothetical protein
MTTTFTPELSATKEPTYNRLPDESAKAYSAFRWYCSLHPSERSISAAYAIYCGEKSSKTDANKQKKAGRRRQASGHFQQWYSQFSWKERAHVWDEEQYALQVEREALVREEMLRRQAEEARQASNVLNELRHHAEALMEDGRMQELTMKELMDALLKAVALLPKLHQAERTALGIHPQMSLELKEVDWEKASNNEINVYLATGKMPLSACCGTVKVQ